MSSSAPRAYLNLRQEPRLRSEGFAAGFKALGYDVRGGCPPAPRPGDVMVIWNRYGDNHLQANRAEAGGCLVIVAENGYLGAGGSTPKFDLDGGFQPGHYIALARHGHNGSGEWPGDGEERWQLLGVDLAPWRSSGKHILVCPNRSFGRPDLIMPADWADKVCRHLHDLTGRPVVVRPHPGSRAPKRPLAAELEECWAVVIWSSSAGVFALLKGIPVFCRAPAWILKHATGNCIDRFAIEQPCMPERVQHFHRLSWAQWTLAEIATGEPLKRLLEGK